MVETINIEILYHNPRFKPWAKKQIFFTTVSTVCANEIFPQIDVCVTQIKNVHWVSKKFLKQDIRYHSPRFKPWVKETKFST